MALVDSSFSTHPTSAVDAPWMAPEAQDTGHVIDNHIPLAMAMVLVRLSRVGFGY